MRRVRKKNSLLSFISFIIRIVIIIIIIRKIFFGGYKQNKELIVKYDLATDSIPDPVQVSMEPTYEYFTIRGVNVSIKKLAKYDITGKVEGKRYYSTDPISNYLIGRGPNVTNYISPIDLALSWGEIAKESNSNHITFTSAYLNKPRFAYYRYDNYLIEKYGEPYINTHVSNNHVIALDKNLRKQLYKIKVGKIVRLVGYLVYVITDTTTWGPSSLVRTDRGDTACEIVYIKDMVIMP